MARNRLVEYFDLQSKRRAMAAQPRTGQPPPPAPPVFPQYIALVLGIVAQPYVEHYARTGGWDVSVHDILGRVIFGLLVGVAIFPKVYKSAFDPDRPFIVQLCAIFAAGLGWQSLIHLGAKAAGLA